ncbi:hypothetical protein NSMS1_33610 [Nostoc sp. MS1]|nr:hypothetical protein NSMS1_33610 [Nostoc sp. MS1]
MGKQATLQTDEVPQFEDNTFVRSQFDVQKQIVTSVKRSQSDAEIDNTIEAPTCVCLNLEDLKCFEVVEHQYEYCGVIFGNSIAIQPSNPAFPTNSGLTVLMGAPKSGFLEAKFLRPVSKVSACITSSQRLVMSAYARDRQLLTQSILPSANLANSDSVLPPNSPLFVTTQNIYSVTFCAFDGQFTLSDFCFYV